MLLEVFLPSWGRNFIHPINENWPFYSSFIFHIPHNLFCIIVCLLPIMINNTITTSITNKNLLILNKLMSQKYIFILCYKCFHWNFVPRAHSITVKALLGAQFLSWYIMLKYFLALNWSDFACLPLLTLTLPLFILNFLNQTLLALRLLNELALIWGVSLIRLA